MPLYNIVVKQAVNSECAICGYLIIERAAEEVILDMQVDRGRAIQFAERLRKTFG
jgi:hypothetical protein